jgi:hypothetical protein
MRAKGVTDKAYITEFITAISTAERFGDITYDEARYIVLHLPPLNKASIDNYMSGRCDQRAIGLPKYRQRGGRNGYMDRR